MTIDFTPFYTWARDSGIEERLIQDFVATVEIKIILDTIFDDPQQRLDVLQHVASLVLPGNENEL